MKLRETHRYFVAKLLGGLFAAILAPIFVSVCANLIQKKLEGPPAPEKAAAPAEKPKDGRAAGPGGAEPAPGEPAKAVTAEIPDGPTIRLFNGKDLAGFHTYLGLPHGKHRPLGLDNDPDGVFSVTKDGLIRISGEVNGALETADEYENYHLSVEYRWGERRWPPREDAERISGVVVHCTGPEGSSHQAWRPGFRCRIADHQGAGDLALFPTPAHQLSVAVEAELSRPGPRLAEGKESLKNAPKRPMIRYAYQPDAPLTTVTGNTLIHRLGAPPGTVPAHGSPRPPDTGWHTLECQCQGDKLTILWDGKTVLQASKLSQSRGKIQFISDGAEIYFRNIELRPLPKTMP